MLPSILSVRRVPTVPLHTAATGEHVAAVTPLELGLVGLRCSRYHIQCGLGMTHITQEQDVWLRVAAGETLPHVTRD